MQDLVQRKGKAAVLRELEDYAKSPMTFHLLTAYAQGPLSAKDYKDHHDAVCYAQTVVENM